jgi:hypothetical protein
VLKQYFEQRRASASWRGFAARMLWPGEDEPSMPAASLRGASWTAAAASRTGRRSQQHRRAGWDRDCDAKRQDGRRRHRRRRMKPGSRVKGADRNPRKLHGNRCSLYLLMSAHATTALCTGGCNIARLATLSAIRFAGMGEVGIVQIRWDITSTACTEFLSPSLG